MLAGLLVCLVVVTFTMMTEVPKRDGYYPPDPTVSMRVPAHRMQETAPFIWDLGTSYYLAVGAFALTHIIAAVLVSHKMY